MIYLIDTIGIHTGAHYYDESFYKVFKEHNVEVKVLSNFQSDHSHKLFDNFYKGGRLKKAWFFLKSYLKYICFICLHWRRGVFFVYQCFGMRIIDILFIVPFALSGKFVVDIHDVYSFHKTKFFPKIQRMVYRNFTKAVIIHSEQTRKTLSDIPFKGKVIDTLHLRYMFDKRYDISNLPGNLVDSIEPSKFNFLFFGDIRESKGLDILIDALTCLNKSCLSKINLIIAGVDKTDILQQEDEKITGGKFSCHVFNRRIEEQEVSYLFSNVDYIILPYKDIYQSGVLEVSIYFKVPFIASDLPLFRNAIETYPSYGYLFSPISSDGLSKTLSNIIENHVELNHYSTEDVTRYYMSDKVDKFVRELREWFNLE